MPQATHAVHTGNGQGVRAHSKSRFCIHTQGQSRGEKDAVEARGCRRGCGGAVEAVGNARGNPPFNRMAKTLVKC
jgi:hypothetical protein